MARQILDARAEGCEPSIARLPLHEPKVDLLDDDGDLEQREGLVERDRRQIAAASGGALARVGQRFSGGHGLAIAMAIGTLPLLPIGIADAGSNLLDPRLLAIAFDFEPTCPSGRNAQHRDRQVR